MQYPDSGFDSDHLVFQDGCNGRSDRSSDLAGSTDRRSHRCGRRGRITSLLAAKSLHLVRRPYLVILIAGEAPCSSLKSNNNRCCFGFCNLITAWPCWSWPRQLRFWEFFSVFDLIERQALCWSLSRFFLAYWPLAWFILRPSTFLRWPGRPPLHRRRKWLRRSGWPFPRACLGYWPR